MGRAQRQALLIGVGGLLWPLPPMLAAAGFTVDVATLPSAHFRHRVHVRRVIRRPDRSAALLAAAELDSRHRYEWIIVGDDETLIALRDHPALTTAQKVRLAPVTGPEQLAHLGSKVELSRRLSAAGLPTPRFAVAHSAQEASTAAAELGWPVYVKADEGSAGRGVIRCEGPGQVQRAWENLDCALALVQEGLPGPELDLSAIYVNGDLVHFTTSEMRGSVPGRALAQCKRYRPAAETPPATVAALRSLGRVLGADGFANISAVVDKDDCPRFIEADLRPTVWAAYGSRVGDDPVARLRAFHDGGRWLLAEQLGAPVSGSVAAEVDIAFFTRMRRRDLLRGSANVWGHFPWHTPDAWALFLRQLLTGGEAHACGGALTRRGLPAPTLHVAQGDSWWTQ